LTKNVNSVIFSIVSEVGKRLKNVRIAKGLSLRKFAGWLEEDSSVVFHIETGRRFPPKPRLEKFAAVLSLTERQLEALIAVERKGLDTFEMLPEIVPAAIPTDSIEDEAEKILNEYCRASNKDTIEVPIPVADVIKTAYDLSTEDLDFAKEGITGSEGGALYGCLYPSGFRRLRRAVLVNTGKISGHLLSSAEKLITVAHEAGHYALHYGKKESKQLFFRFSKEPTYCRKQEIKPTPFNLKEEQANLFAACLLMPRKQFRETWEKEHGDKSRLARHFCTTESFVQLRAEMLDL
jgi:transcriptional regulator with XRE-family HTH domain